MGNIHVVQKLQTSVAIHLANLDSATYDYRFTLEANGNFLEYIYNGSSNSVVVPIINNLQPNTGYIIFLYRANKGNTNWGSFIDATTVTTNARTEPSTANYFPSYLTLIQDQFVYENGVYKGEANSCVSNCLSLAMDVLAYTNRTGNPQNNHFSPSYIYGNRSRQTSLNTEVSGMFCNKTIEQLNIDGTPIWSHIPQNDNGYKTFPDNRFLTNGYNAGFGASGDGAKTIFDNRSDTLDKQAKVNRMSFPISYNYNLSGNLFDGSSYSYTFTGDFSPFFDGTTIANRVQTYGYCAMNFHIANNFYTVPSNGITSQPNSWSGFAHCSAILGWITISGIKYWICQNSWGSDWGDDGFFYLPMDYGASGSVISGTIWNGYANVQWIWNWIFDINVASHVQPALPSVPTSPIGDTIPRFDSGLNIKWTAGANNDTFDLRYRIGSGSYTTSTGLNRSTRQITGLGYGVTYGFSVRGVNYRGGSSYSSENSLTTAPKTPTITASSVDVANNRVSITIGGMTGNYSFFRIWYRNVTDGGSWVYLQVNTIGSHWVTGLLNDKEYEFKVSSFYTVSSVDIESRDSVGNIGYSDSVFYTINNRPDNWAWSYNIASGQDVASVDNKDIFIMPATEWNNFTTRINEFRNYKSLADYSFTIVSSNGEVTRTIINQALDAIRAMNSHFTGGNTLISNRVAGQNILEANIYINMRNCLNSIL